MWVTVQCENCKKTTLTVELFGPDNEYRAQCPVCGPVFGHVMILGIVRTETAGEISV